MSWWFGRSSEPESQVPEITHGQKQKHKQIECLKEQVVGVIELKRDEHYRVTCTSKEIPLTLDITLPARFPLCGPVVRVSPPICHPWVNTQMVVDGSPLIKNVSPIFPCVFMRTHGVEELHFHVNTDRKDLGMRQTLPQFDQWLLFTVHSNLGRAIKQVINEFVTHPPELLPPESSMASMLQPPQPSSLPSQSQPQVVGGGYTPYTFSSMPQPVASQSGARASPERPRRPPPPPPSVKTPSYQGPPVPDTLADIQTMSTEELNRFLSDEEGPVLIDRYVSQMDVIKKVQMDRERLFQENEDQATINIGHEPELHEGWEQLQQKFFELEALKEDHAKMLKEQLQLIEKYKLKAVMTSLKATFQDSETESEITAEDFMDNKMQVMEFVRTYTDQRKLHHLRKAKHEKLTYSGSAKY